MLEPDNTDNTAVEGAESTAPEATAESTATDAAPKKRPAKKAAAKKAPAKKAAAKRSPKKAAAADADGVEPAAGPEDVITAEPVDEGATEPASAASPPAVLFQAAADVSTSGVIEVAEELAEEIAEESEVTVDEVREAAADEATTARKRRRRGRRGRGGRGSASDDADGAEDDETADDAADEAEGEESSDAEGAETEDAADSAGGSTKRRRRRRRSGSAGTDASEDDPPNTVTHVRPPRSDSEGDGVRGVKGSTRLEAKRQRRRDGRDNSRRRPPILSEAEFLARREAVDRVMAVRQKGDRTQIAVLEDGVLVEHYVTRASTTSYVGNIYLGRVQNVLPSMEAAFIDISKGRNGVLYAGEVNWDAAGLEGKSRNIESALKSGDVVLVQVTKDPIGHKGARLTSQISLPGRFLVYVPGGGMTGISRKLPDTERHRLKSILKKIVPEDAGVIIRTAAEGASEEELTHDVHRLQAQWEQIKAKAEKVSSAPLLVHGEPDLAIRVVRDVFNEDFKQLIVEGDSTWTTISEYVDGVAPDLRERVKRHVSEKDLFHELRVDEQLMKGLDRKVWLPSGGSLVIDRTEAMTVIDVNTGKFVGSGGNLEQTVTRNNLEAAEEIVRQLRLRDVGGIVVIDFIDMVLESNRELVLRRLTECLGRDRTKHQVAEVTSLGLVQMTRKRVGEGLLEAFSEPCEHCRGRGVIVHADPVERAGQAPSFDDDMPPQNGKSRRKRGGGGGGGSSAKKAEEPVEDPEAKAKRLAAMNAIHAAAHHEDGDVPPAEFAEAVAEAGKEAVLVELEAEREAVTEAVDEAELMEAAIEEAEVSEVVADLVTAAIAAQDAIEDEVDPMAWLEAAAESLAADEDAAQDEGRVAAPKRRRRAASRPAGPPSVGG
jgi:ribonuclease E